jgi:hypothetical protein
MMSWLLAKVLKDRNLLVKAAEGVGAPTAELGRNWAKELKRHYTEKLLLLCTYVARSVAHGTNCTHLNTMTSQALQQLSRQQRRR